MKVRCLRPGLPKRVSTHPKARGIKSAADITISGRLALKVVVFEKQRDMVHFWTEVLGKPHLGRKTRGAVNALSHQVTKITPGKPDRATLWVDPRYFAIMGLVHGHLTMEIVVHESVHAAFCYAKRCKRTPWAHYADFDEEEVAYPAGRIARALNAYLHDEGLYATEPKRLKKAKPSARP